LSASSEIINIQVIMIAFTYSTTLRFTTEADANGNITEYTDSQGNTIAHYEYSPFGQVTFQSGDLADGFAYKFSTKYWDEETGLGLWGLRYYHPDLGRWISRDSIEEQGGFLLYGYVENDAINDFDPYGEMGWDCCACAAALIGKLGGSVAGCVYGCLEVKSDSYGFGQCYNDCITSVFTPEQLWESFKGNPAEWVGAAACVSCGVRAIKDLIDKAKAPKRPDPTPKPPKKPDPPKKDKPRPPKGCKPCMPPVGTIGYEIHEDDIRGRHKGTPHVKLRVVEQYGLQAPPPYACACHWSKPSYVPGTIPPIGSIPMVGPVMGGGVYR
jgi:RHS repeat-associated protein